MSTDQAPQNDEPNNMGRSAQIKAENEALRLLLERVLYEVKRTISTDLRDDIEAELRKL